MTARTGRAATGMAGAALALGLVTAFIAPAAADETPNPNAPWPSPGASVEPTDKPVYSLHGSATSLQPDSTRKPLVVVETNQEKGGQSFTIPADVLFDKDSATLSDNASANLDDVVQKLQDASVTGDVQIIGHTDDTGSTAHNKTLSKQRAKAVYEAMRPKLAGSGITLKWSGVGEKDPLVKNDSEANRKRNRRVAFVYKADAPTTSTTTDDYDISVPLTQTADKPSDAPSGVLGSAQRSYRDGSSGTTFTVRVDVNSLRRQDGLLCLRLTTTLVSQNGTDSFDDVGAVYSGTTDISNENTINAYLFDPAKKQKLGPLITGTGAEVENLGFRLTLTPPDSGVQGYIYFPAPTTGATKLSLYLPGMGTIDNLPIK